MKISAENLAKLRIIRTQNIGPKTFHKLMRRYATALNALDACGVWASEKFSLCSDTLLQRELDMLHNAKASLVFYGDDTYPAALRELPDAPIVLSVLGDVAHLARRQVAIVGNRSASAAGLAWTRTLATDLARAGVCITSGLARGIDTAAHEGALLAGSPTIAVVAGGVDHIYPPENAALRGRIIEHGCVVSEQPWGMVPTASLFPQRNRIIAGLSVGVVVSEATRHSGSLITAECALGYGREVWAVPGTPSDQRSSGPNWLLKNGAALVEHAADILPQLPHSAAPYLVRYSPQANLFDDEGLAPLDDPMALPEAPLGLETPPARTRLFALLGHVPATFDELLRQTGLSEAEANALLVELELDGHATRDADGRWRRGVSA